MSFTTDLIYWSIKTYCDETCPTPVAQLQNLFMDWLACLGQGLKSPSTLSLMRSLGDSACSPSDLSTLKSVDKALLLGFASHCKEMDDSEFTGETHPSAVILSALLSFAKDEVPMENFLRCAWVGYQSLRPLGRALNPQHYASGWHGTGTLGVYASTLSASLLQNLNETQIENAIGISATMASGIQASFGTQSKYLNSGRASSNAVLSVLLTKNGMTGSMNVFETQNGVFQMFGNSPSFTQFYFDPKRDTSLNWIKIKKYPGCHCLEPIIETSLSLAIKIKDCGKIQKVRLYLSNYDFNIIGQRAPKTIEGAYFSASHMVALSLIEKHIDFSTDLLNQNSEITNLEKKIELFIDENLMAMECKLQVEYSNDVYEKESKLIRDANAPDMSFLERKFSILVRPFAKSTDATEQFSQLLNHKNVTVGQVKDFTRQVLGFSI